MSSARPYLGCEARLAVRPSRHRRRRSPAGATQGPGLGAASIGPPRSGPSATGVGTSSSGSADPCRRTLEAQGARNLRHQAEKVKIMRATLDKLISWGGLLLVVVLLVAGGLLTWASTYIGNEVHDQLA